MLNSFSSEVKISSIPSVISFSSGVNFDPSAEGSIPACTFSFFSVDMSHQQLHRITKVLDERSYITGTIEN